MDSAKWQSNMYLLNQVNPKDFWRSACFCTGRCRQLGYCPNSTTATEAVQAHKAAIARIEEALDSAPS